MKVHGRLKMFRISKATGPFLHGRNLGIHALGNRIGDAMRKVRHHVRQVPNDQLSCLDDGLEAAVRGPEVPALSELPGPDCRLVAPQGTQRLLDRPGPSRFQFRSLQATKMGLGLSRHVLRVGQPQIFTPVQSFIPGLEQRLVFLFAHLVDRLQHMAHDVKPVEHHFPVRIGNVTATGADIGRPHVQTDGLDARSLRLRQGFKIPGQTVRRAPFTNVLDRRGIQVTDQGHVAMSLGDRLLVNADLARGVAALGSPAPLHRPLHQVPGFVPADAQKGCGFGDIGRQQHVDGKRLKQVGKPAGCAHGKATW